MKLPEFLVDGLLIRITGARATLLADDATGTFMLTGRSEDLVDGLIGHGVSPKDARSLISSDGIHVVERKDDRILITRMARAKEIN